MKRILILGGGFGGVTVATELIRRLGATHEVVLVDRRDRFLMGLRKLWALVDLGGLDEGSRALGDLQDRGIRVVHETVTAIHPAERRVDTTGETLEADYMVVALGAEPRGDLVPGLDQHAFNAWDVDRVPALADAVAAFRGGRIAVVIAGVPYKCPPAPYECAMLLDEHLRDRKVRDATDLVVTTLQPMLLPNAGAEGSAWLGEQLDAREITYQVGRKPVRFDPGTVMFEDEALSADLMIAIPPHRPPSVVRDSGLTGEGEWVQVDPGTLATTFPGVFAIGEVTQIRLANGLPLPKAGLFAEREGERVAAAIAADVTGGPPPPDFDGVGFCFIEMGKSAAARVDGEFFAEPEPRVQLGEPSGEHAAAKRLFEAERLERWFGT